MKIIKVISGGQTGADISGLVAAKICKIQTGGTAPFGYKTEKGSNFDLRDLFQLTESKSELYIPRTYRNVRVSDMTFWFGSTKSPGFYATTKACEMYKKKWWGITSENKIQDTLDYMNYIFKDKNIILNVAGNRKSKNPDIEDFTYTFMVKFLDAMLKQL